MLPDKVIPKWENISQLHISNCVESVSDKPQT